MENGGRKIDISGVFAQLEKKYGKGIIMKLGEKQQSSVPILPTGSLALNVALGIGGYPKGRIIEIYGPAASGKTTLAMHAMAESQGKGERVLLIDSEHAFDKRYAKALGIDIEELLICQPDHGEQALDVAEHMIRSGAVGLVVIDSVSALIPVAESQGNIGVQQVGGQARLMSQAMRKLTSLVYKSGAIALFINQVRYKIGVFYGDPETTSGGNALRFYASVRLKIRPSRMIKDQENRVIGHYVKVQVVKNKLAPPFQEAVMAIHYGKGICPAVEMVDMGLSLGLLTRSGAWYSYENQRLGQGREAAISLLQSDKALREKLGGELSAKLALD